MENRRTACSTAILGILALSDFDCLVCAGLCDKLEISFSRFTALAATSRT